jgi:hypothetical protein
MLPVDHPMGGGQPDGDGLVTYTLNSYGYRANKFDFGESEILYTGCSQTYGRGVKMDSVWGELIASKLGKSATNIGRDGAGIASLVDSVYIYLANNKKPEKIYALFPDLGRSDIIINKKYAATQDAKSMFSSSRSYTPLYHSGVVDHNFGLALSGIHVLKNKYKTKIAKSPYAVEDVYPYEDSMYKNIRAIKQLETLCNLLGIELIWSTWDAGFEKSIEKLQSIGYEFKNYVPTGCSAWVKHNGEYPKLDCHSDLEAEHAGYFHIGCDKIGHIGAHHHIHISEVFCA